MFLDLNRSVANGSILGDLTINSLGSVNLQKASNQIADGVTVTVNSAGLNDGINTYSGIGVAQ